MSLLIDILARLAAVLHSALNKSVFSVLVLCSAIFDCDEELLLYLFLLLFCSLHSRALEQSPSKYLTIVCSRTPAPMLSEKGEEEVAKETCDSILCRTRMRLQEGRRSVLQMYSGSVCTLCLIMQASKLWSSNSTRSKPHPFFSHGRIDILPNFRSSMKRLL